MSEKGSPFLNFVAHLIFGSAEEKDMVEDTVGGLIAAHQLNDAGGKHPPFAVMKPKVRQLVEHEVDGADGAVESLQLKNIGHVRLKSNTAGPAVQTLAERVDHHASKKRLQDAEEAKTVENAKRAVLKIEDEIADKAGW